MDAVHRAATVKNLIRATIPRPVRNWLRSPSKSAEWLWDSARFYFGVKRVLPLTPDWSIVCHPQAYKAAHQAQVNDADQRAEFQHFLSYCSNEMLLFDIGAHFGVFSLAAARFGGKAVAVDPSPTAARMIAIQADLNGFTDSIQILRSAVSDANGVMGLLSAGVFTYGYFKVVKGRSRRELTDAPAITLDEMVHQFGVPTHIKIDVEGHEAAVLRGGRATLSMRSPLLFLELHNEMIRAEGGDPNSALDELARLGYTTFDQDDKIMRRSAILREPIIRVLAKRADLAVTQVRVEA